MYWNSCNELVAARSCATIVGAEHDHTITQSYCKQIEKAIELGKVEKIEIEFYPKFMLSRAEEALKQCKSE